MREDIFYKKTFCFKLTGKGKVSKMRKDILSKLVAPVKGNQGIAFVTMLVVSTVLSMGAAAYFVQSAQEAGTIQNRVDSTQALYAAETAIEYAKYQLKTDETKWSNWTTQTVDSPGVDTPTQVDFTYDAGLNKGIIIATAFDANGVPLRKIKVEVGKGNSYNDPETKTTFAKAACSCEGGVTISGSSGGGGMGGGMGGGGGGIIVDSYLSSEGGYSVGGCSDHDQENGDIGANTWVDISAGKIYGDVTALGDYTASGSSSKVYHDVTVDGSIVLDNRAIIYGNADVQLDYTGNYRTKLYGDLTYGGTYSLGSQAHIYGAKIQQNPNQNFPEDICPCDLDLSGMIEYTRTNNDNSQIDPAYLFDMDGDGNFTDFKIAGNDVYELPGGVYNFSSFVATGNSHVDVTQEVVVYLDTINDPTAELKIAGHASVGVTTGFHCCMRTADANARNLRIYSDTTGPVTIVGNGLFAGTIYAPYSSNFSMTGNSEVFGAIVANSIGMVGNSKIHYDESAKVKEDLPVPGADGPSVDVIAWEELDPFDTQY